VFYIIISVISLSASLVNVHKHTLRLMWVACILAAFSSIIYPAISALVSKNADAEQQGVVLGILTGMRGLCNGLGPAIFGLLFWLSHVNLNDDALEPKSAIEMSTTATNVGNMSGVSMEPIVHVSPTPETPLGV